MFKQKLNGYWQSVKDTIFNLPGKPGPSPQSGIFHGPSLSSIAGVKMDLPWSFVIWNFNKSMNF